MTSAERARALVRVDGVLGTTWEADAERLIAAAIDAAVSEAQDALEEAQAATRVERARTDAAQAEVARRGDVMLAALREIERGEYNEAARLLAGAVRPPLPRFLVCGVAFDVVAPPRRVDAVAESGAGRALRAR
jgi:hypothetical protein